MDADINIDIIISSYELHNFIPLKEMNIISSTEIRTLNNLWKITGTMASLSELID